MNFPATIAVFSTLLLLNLSPISSSDPDPLQDFCVGLVNPARKSKPNGFPCKNPANVSVDDFVFAGIKSPGNFSSTGFSGISVNAGVFPGLNTLGMSFVRADFAPGAINPPHFHPRATEIGFVLEGKLYSGFVDSGNKVYAKVIGKGEVMVFPRGMVHFQMNVGDSPATILGNFDSQNPGVVKLPAAIFGSGIDEELLVKAFGLSGKEIALLEKRLAPKPLLSGRV